MQHHSHPENAISFFPDFLPLVLVIFLLLGYFYLLYRLNKKKGQWNRFKTFFFTVGTLLLAIAFLPSMMEWGHRDMRGHMVQHLIMAMFAPVFLVLGAPLTLILKSLPPGGARKITGLLKKKIVRFMVYPITALILNIGAMYLLYLTPLYNQSHHSPLLHYFIHFHFLAAGYLFTWSIIGTDPVPNRPSFTTRLAVLFVSIAAHAFLSKFMYAYQFPLNSPHSTIEIQEGAKLMYYWGDLSELLLVIILFTIWYRERERPGVKETLKKAYRHN